MEFGEQKKIWSLQAYQFHQYSLTCPDDRFKCPKADLLNYGFAERPFLCLMKQQHKMCTKGKLGKTNENMNKVLLFRSFHIQKEAPPSHKLLDHAYK